MQLFAVVKDTGFQGDGTVLVTLALSQIDGRTHSIEVVIDNPTVALGFNQQVKAAARAAAQAVWGLTVTNANTMLIGE